MIIGGIKKVSLIDYPSEISSVVFTRGCNFRCIYCHNSHLVLPESYGSVTPEEEFFKYLSKRKGLITAVVISGGEPTIHRDLTEFVRRIKKMGYKTKLDTNGANPGVVSLLLRNELIDYIAMDIKTSFAKYDRLCGTHVDQKTILESMRIIQQSAIQHEFRTTVIKGIHTAEDIRQLGILTGGKVTLQRFRYSSTVIQQTLTANSEYTESEFLPLSKYLYADPFSLAP